MRIFFICTLFFIFSGTYAQELERLRKREQILDSVNDETKKLAEPILSDEKFRNELDSVFYLPVFQGMRYRDMDTNLLNYYRFYDLQNRYDLISIGGLNTVSRPFSLLKKNKIGFDNQFLSRGMFQETPLIQTYRPVSKLYFVHDPFYSASSRNTNQLNFLHFQPIGRRISLVIQWNVLGTSGYISENKQNLVEFGSKLYYRNLSANFWSINDYNYQSEIYRVSGGLQDSSMSLIFYNLSGQDTYTPAFGQPVKFYGVNNIWITQKVQSDNYWIFSKVDDIQYLDSNRRSFLRYQFRYYTGQSFFSGKNTKTGDNNYDVGFLQYAQSSNGLKYVADFRKNDAFQNELTFQAYSRIFTPLFLSTLNIGVEHQAGTYINRYYQGAIPVDINFTYNNNFLLKARLRFEIGPFLLENKTIYGFLGYNLNDISMHNILGLETKQGGNFSLTYLFQRQMPSFENLKFNSTFVSYDLYNDTKKEQWNQYQLAYQYTYDNKLIKNQLDVKVNYTYYTHYLTIDSLGYPFSLNNFNYFQINLNHHIAIWKFGLGTEFTYFLHDAPIIDIPTWVYRGSFYYKDIFFKNALGFQTGIDFTYYASYSPWEYVPARQDFSPFAQNPLNFTSGDYPFFDIYVAFKISKTRISIKYTNAFFGYNRTFDRFGQATDVNYFSAKGYLFNESIIKLGIDWLFEY